MPPAVRLAAVLTAVVVVASAVPAWQFVHWQWIALALAAPVVLGIGAPVHRAAVAALHHGRIGMDVFVAAGPLAALGWSVYVLLVGGAGDPGFTQSLTDRTVALDAAAALTVVALAGIDPRAVVPISATRGRRTGDSRNAPRVARFAPPSGTVAARRDLSGVIVSGAAVAVLGFGLGAGAGSGAVAAAVAVLVAGCPCAMWVVARWAGPPDAPGSAVRCDDSEVLRLTAALHAAHPDDPVARAVTAAAGSDLPGVSDADGTPAAGVRGVVSELRGEDLVVAHAVLAGPAGWLAAHGVPIPQGDRAPQGDKAPDGDGWILVAWDGVPRGRIEVVEVPPREAVSTRAGRYVVVTGAFAGAALGTAGILVPATAGVVPLAATALVMLLAGGVAAIRPGRRHPIGTTPG